MAKESFIGKTSFRNLGYQTQLCADDIYDITTAVHSATC